MLNSTNILHSVQLVSSTKDSIYVEWKVYDDYIAHVQGYKVRYQAVGSTVEQYSHLLDPTKTNYDITQLHENTNYDICIKVFTNLSSYGDGGHPLRECIKVSTATDSLSVALGSTFGAFLALGIIVFFVFLAKWQHQRRQKNQLQQAAPSGEYDSMVQQDGDYEMSDVSLQVHEDAERTEFNSQSSQATANGTAAHHPNQVPSKSSAAAKKASMRKKGSLPGPAIPSTSSSATAGSSIVQTVAQVQPPPVGAYPSAASQGAAAGASNPSSPPPPPMGASPSPALPSQQQDGGRPPDVRPKTRPAPIMDLTNPYECKKFQENSQSGLRPNMSCNW